MSKASFFLAIYLLIFALLSSQCELQAEDMLTSANGL